MPARSELAGTTNKYSKENYSTSVQEYLASPSTITERFAFSNATKDSMGQVADKTEKTKKLLDEWQAQWDEMKDSKK
ncbi:hypothetical protein F4806DRAFT_500422 [Annulohypoxylon nitens]|nr:hypothetical protein F4806DRAFT_500422 [Annulohypoxylon nitens]